MDGKQLMSSLNTTTTTALHWIAGARTFRSGGTSTIQTQPHQPLIEV